MKLARTELEGVVEITPLRRADSRGHFAETFRQDWFNEHVGAFSFVQDNQSLSLARGTVRGLHFQSDPAAQGKLVRCIGGTIFDVAVDIRQDSPAYGRWVSVILSAEAGNQLWIPPGFLHGFCTLEASCVVSYKVTNYYDADCDKGVRWNDRAIGIEWPDVADAIQLSLKDSQAPLLRDLPVYFALPKED